MVTLLALVARPGFSQTDDPSLLSVRRIYGSPEFKPELFGPARWLAGGTSYTIQEDSKEGAGQDIVRYNTETGARMYLSRLPSWSRLGIPPRSISKTTPGPRTRSSS